MGLLEDPFNWRSASFTVQLNYEGSCSTSRWSWQEGIEECGKHHALDHHEVVVESQSVPPKLLAPVPGIHHRLFRITGLRLPMSKIKLRKVEFALAEMTG